MVEHCELGDGAIIDPFTLILFLKEFTLGPRSRVAIFTKIYGPGTFRAEARCLVSVQCLIECSGGRSVIMKNYSCFGPRNTIYTHGEYLPRLQGYPFKRGDVVIEEYAWTGMSTTILAGTIIGRNTITAPGAVLRSRVPSDAFIVPRACSYDVHPISRVMSTHGSDEIQRYILNALAGVTRDDEEAAQLHSDDLFRAPALTPPREFMGKQLLIFAKGMTAAERPGDAIVVGYDLPREIRDGSIPHWLDFRDYTAGGKSDRAVIQLVERLYSRFAIRFIVTSAQGSGQ
jgi:acetyltransferase-like isoleucine patch superfamily enzyme